MSLGVEDTRHGQGCEMEEAAAVYVLSIVVRWIACIIGPLVLMLSFGTALSREPSWTATWMSSQHPPLQGPYPASGNAPEPIHNQTVRQIARVSLGGNRARVVLSNEFGDKDLTVGAASIAVAKGGSTVDVTTVRQVTFGGENAIVIPPGASVISDAADLRVDPLSRLAVSFYLPDETKVTTLHWDGGDKTYIAAGEHSGAEKLPPGQDSSARFFLSEILVDAAARGTVVTLGDSITDHNGSGDDSDTRWPDFLAQRLAPCGMAVVNAGISGGRLLHDGMGRNALSRFSHDVLTLPNITALIVLIGINDIGFPGSALSPEEHPVSPAEMVAGYQQLAEFAHAHRIRIIAATLLPFEGATYFTKEKESVRRQVNTWIRSSHTFDAVVDLDSVARDPTNPQRLDPRFDLGDHLHPSEWGRRKIADAIDIRSLVPPRFRTS